MQIASFQPQFVPTVKCAHRRIYTHVNYISLLDFSIFISHFFDLFLSFLVHSYQLYY